MIAEVIIDSKAKQLNRKFDYEIPEKLQDLLVVGSRVLVPFGNMKALEQGYIINIKDKSEYKVKQIFSLEENLSKEKINLARWMARKYYCSVSECIKLMLAPGSKSKNKNNRIKNKILNHVYFNIPYDNINKSDIKGIKQIELIEFLKNNQGITVSEIENITRISRSTINSLVKKNILRIIDKKIDRNPLVNKKIKSDKKLIFNSEQQVAFNKVKNVIEKERFEEFLLYGVTRFWENRGLFTIDR